MNPSGPSVASRAFQARSSALTGAALLLAGLSLSAPQRSAMSAPSSPSSTRLPIALQAKTPASGKYWVYIGTYTGAKSKGIYRFQLDLATGQATEPELAGEITSPSFLAIHPKGNALYAVNEVSDFEGKRTGAVTSYKLDPKTGQLQLLNQKPSEGAGPCHISLAGAGDHVLIANYGAGSIAAYPTQADGSLGAPTAAVQHRGMSVNRQRQEAPHAHSINVDPTGKYVVAADLGLDKVLIYRYDRSKGTLEPNDPAFAPLAPGSGPRHFAFHPNQKNAYVINEMLSTITTFAFDAKAGALNSLQTVSTLPDDFKGNTSTAEIQVHPNGRWVYGSNRGHDSIAMFSVQSETGMLTPLGHEPTGGKTPRNFGIDPTGRFLLAANQGSDTVTVFRINQDTGRLSPTGTSVKVGTPVCVKFLAVP